MSLLLLFHVVGSTPPPPPDPGGGVAPAVQVMMGFNPAISSAYFHLDHDTLDGLAVLAPTTFPVDVSAYLRGSITCSRGRSRDVDAVQAGRVTFTLNNDGELFNPLNQSSPYYPGIVPRTPVSVFVAGQQVFGGYVDDYTIEFIKPALSNVTVIAVDGFALLATTKLASASFSAQTSDARIAAVLARPEVNYPGGSTLATGTATLQASTQDQVAALDHVQTAAASEAGLVYVDRGGALQFRNRDYLAIAVAANPQGSLVLTDNTAGHVGQELYDYVGVGMVSAVQLLYNRIEGSRSGGTKQTADDTASQSNFGIRTLSLPTLENDNDTDVLALCSYLLGRYAEPEVRFDHVTVELVHLSALQQTHLAMLDIGSIVMAERRAIPGTPITQLSVVEHMDWTLDVSTSAYTLTLGLGDASSVAYFLLDSSTAGLLDTNTLGF